MGGVVSVSGKSSHCKDRVKLAILALQQQEALANAQKNYNALQDKMGTTFSKFVGEHYVLSSDPAAKLQDAIHEEEKEEDPNEKDSSIEIEKMKITSKNEDSSNGKERGRKGGNYKKRNTNMVAEKAEASAEKAEASAKEDNNVETPESKRLSLSDVEVWFKEVCESGSCVCGILDTKSGQVESRDAKDYKNMFRRSFTWRRSTISKPVARSRSSRVSDHSREEEGAATHYSTLEDLCGREKSLESLVEAAEEKKKIGDTREAQYAKETAEEAFDKIEKLREAELLPQLRSLLKSLQEYWKIMSVNYVKQHEIMSEESVYKPHEKCCSAADHYTATVILQTELHNWCAAFSSYVSSQRSYVNSLHSWSTHSLPSFFKKEENVEEGKCTTLLRDWSACLEQLEDKEVSKAMSEFGREVTKLRDQQNKELECKRKVDNLDEDIRKLQNSNFDKVLEETGKSTKKKYKKKSKKTWQEKKEKKLNVLRKKLENEEKAYQTSKTETQKIVPSLIQERFALVFKSLADFTTKAAEEYAEVAKKHGIVID